MKVYNTNGDLLITNSPEAPFTVQIPGDVSVKEAKADGENLIEVLQQVLTELKINNHYLAELPKLLNAGINNQDDPEILRKEY